MEIFKILNTTILVTTAIFIILLYTSKRSGNKSIRFLGLHMLVVFVWNFLYWVHNVAVISTNVAIIAFPLYLMQPPLFYLYIKSLADENFRINKNILVHFIPVILLVVFNIIALTLFIVKISDMFLWYKEKGTYLTMLIYYLQFIAYLILILLTLKQHGISIRSNFSDIEHIRLRWLKFCIWLYFIYVPSDLLIFFFLDYTVHVRIGLDLYYIVFIFLLGFFGLKQNEIYSVFSEDRKIQSHKDIPKTLDIPIGSVDTIMSEENALSNELMETIFQRLDYLLTNDRIFLNISLNSHDLAKLLNTNRTYLSKTIQEKFNTNFYNLINLHRVEEAKKYLSDEKFDKYNLDGIAEISGFASRVALGRSFKSLTGETPTEFKQRVRIQS